MQLAAALLFFYVFGLGAVLLTWYTVRIITQYVQESREKEKRKKPAPDMENEPIKLHISDGRIVVNRLPEEP